MKKIFCFVAVSVLCICGISFAAEGKGGGPEAIEVLTGWAHAKLHAKGGYSLVPLIVDFDFNLKPLTQKIGLNPPTMLQFQLEPFISTAYEPHANVEIGNAFMLKVGLLPEDFKLQPYIKGGVGMLYMTQHTNEQSTQFNFLEQGCVGAQYLLTQNTAFIFEGRFRHVSNSGIDHPNHGINTYFALVGISYKFE